MRHAFATLMIASLPWLAAGCAGTEPDPDENGGTRTIQTPKDLREQQKRVLQLLQTFEEHDLAVMDASVTELEEMAKSELNLVSPEIQEQLKKYRVRSSANDAIDRLRWISKFARSLLLLEGDDPAKWGRCRDIMVKSGPEAVVRFTGVLIVKFTDNPRLCRPMLMELCESHRGLVHDAILEALAFQGKDQPGAMKMRLLDDTAKQGLVSTLLFLKDPPVTKIRESATRGPDSTRRAWAAILPSRKTKDAAGTEISEPWTVELLALLAQSDPDWQVRATAALSLGETGDVAQALPALTKTLKDKDHWVRRNTCVSIGRFGARAQAAIGPMIGMLKGLETELFETEVDRKIERLPLAGNPKRELEKAGLVALKAVTGKPFVELGSFFAWWDER